MTALAGLTRGGKNWTPQFVTAINYSKCLGCGRCLKVCGRDVLGLRPMNEEGEFVDDDDDEEFERKVMIIANADNCIGCEACARVCPKQCHTHTPYEQN